MGNPRGYIHRSHARLRVQLDSCSMPVREISLTLGLGEESSPPGEDPVLLGRAKLMVHGDAPRRRQHSSASGGWTLPETHEVKRVTEAPYVAFVSIPVLMPCPFPTVAAMLSRCRPGIGTYGQALACP